MRLWNLVTGKRAGVLTFERGVLSAVGEGKFRGGEGRVVVWSGDGEEFAVGFERGVVVFGLDCAVRGAVKVEGSKVCQVRFCPVEERKAGVLAVSTEDGRVLFYDTDAKSAVVLDEKEGSGEKKGKDAGPPPPMCRMLGQVGTSGKSSRVKDFEIFATGEETFVLVTGTSDGSIRLWLLKQADLFAMDSTTTSETDEEKTGPRQIGTLLASHETGRRITCLTGFVMDQPGDAAKYASLGKKVKTDESEDEDGGVEVDGEEGGDFDDSDEEELEKDANEEEDEFGGFDE